MSSKASCCVEYGPCRGKFARVNQTVRQRQRAGVRRSYGVREELGCVPPCSVSVRGTDTFIIDHRPRAATRRGASPGLKSKTRPTLLASQHRAWIDTRAAERRQRRRGECHHAEQRRGARKGERIGGSNPGEPR